LHQGPIRIT